MNTTTFHKLLESGLVIAGLLAFTATLALGCQDTEWQERRREAEYDRGYRAARREAEEAEHKKLVRDREACREKTGERELTHQEKIAAERKAALARYHGLCSTVVYSSLNPGIPVVRKTGLVVKCNHPNCAKESYLEDWRDLDLTELPDTIGGWDVPDHVLKAYFSFTCPHCRLTIDGHSNDGSPRYSNPWLRQPPLIVPEDSLRVPKPVMTRREWSLIRNYDDCGNELFDPENGYFSPGAVE